MCSVLIGWLDWTSGFSGVTICIKILTQSHGYITENKDATIPWDMQIHTDREIAANKPDINQVSYDHRSYEFISYITSQA